MSKRLLIGMSVELAVFLVVILGASTFLLFFGRPIIAPVIERIQQAFGRQPSPSPTPVPGGREETTAIPGVYSCTGGKSFTLTVRGDGTARVSGAASSGVVLRRTEGTNIWTSGDRRVAVREIADYTVLVENDVVTRDLCRLR